MPRVTLPRELTLPSGRIVRLRLDPAAAPRTEAPRRERFGDALALFESGKVTLTAREGARIDVGSLPLGDFHVLRAVATRAGLLPEEEVEITCRNCHAAVRVRPCAGLEIGPWEHGELGDDELDTTLPFGEPIDVPPIPLGRVRTATTVTFAPRTVTEARPLLRALAAEGQVVIDPSFVEGMGLSALGTEKDPAKIARALTECEDGAFDAVAEGFLASHYVLRLGCIALCASCGARNDVDAPYERELEASATRPPRADRAAATAFPDLDAFAERAKEIAKPLLADVPGEPVELVVEDGTPAVDDGGEPLLGSYVPPHPGDMASPTRPPVVTVYYRTFLAMWNEDGPYDWDDELTETIEHELEHHLYFLRGDDPMDDEERAVIRDEALRVVGKREASRRAIEGFGASLGDFARRTWPLWILVLAALLATLATQR